MPRAESLRNTLPDVPRQSRPRMVVMSFRLPVATKEALDQKAQARGLNPTEVVRELVTEWAEDES